jgi:subtilisin family serine protease
MCCWLLCVYLLLFLCGFVFREMNRQLDANILGYIVRIKNSAVGLNTNSTAQDIYERANAIMRRCRPFGTSIPPVYNICVKCVRAFAIPIVNDIYIANLIADVDVMSVDSDIEMTVYSQNVGWGVSRIGGTAVHSASSIDGTGQMEGMNIFVMDTGVANHPDIRLVQSRSFVPYEMISDDFHGHGTAVAGVIAARDNTEGIVGVCPGAKIYSYKCLDKNGRGQMSWALSAIEAIYVWKLEDLGHGRLGIVNISFGAFVGTYGYTVLDYAIHNLVELGIVVVVAAGNDGGISGLYTPAHVDKALTVGAYDYENTLARWSNYGSSVDILAPGANILTTSVNLKNRKSIYGTFAGTSFAAAYVSGAAALYLGMNYLKTPDEVRNALKSLGEIANTAGNNPLITCNVPDTTRISVYIPATTTTQ